MTLAERYVELLAEHAPVVDVGCGAGGSARRPARSQASRAEGSTSTRAWCQKRKRAASTSCRATVCRTSRSLPDGSVGAITAIHVIEHLVFADLVRFLDLAAAKLRPGGVLVCETPNPTALIVLGHSYILDPTHKWPLHPSLVTFLCERAGFADVDVRFHSPADFFAVPLLDETIDAPAQVATINEALHRLNSVLFGPQEYAIVAAKSCVGGALRRLRRAPARDARATGRREAAHCADDASPCAARTRRRGAAPRELGRRPDRVAQRVELGDAADVVRGQDDLATAAAAEQPCREQVLLGVVAIGPLRRVVLGQEDVVDADEDARGQATG